MDDLIAFVKAQLAEDDRRNPWPWWAKGRIRQPRKRARITREIAAKRAILTAFAEEGESPDYYWGLTVAVKALAAVYSDRPGYRRE